MTDDELIKAMVSAWMTAPIQPDDMSWPEEADRRAMRAVLAVVRAHDRDEASDEAWHNRIRDAAIAAEGGGMNIEQVSELCEQIREGASTSDVVQWLADHAGAELAAARADAETLKAANWQALILHGDTLARAEKAEAEAARLRKLLHDALRYAEWHDKHIWPYDGEVFQQWELQVYLHVPLSEPDKSPEAALERLLQEGGRC